MYRQMKKWMLCILAAFLMVFASQAAAFAAEEFEHKIVIDDQADLLSDEEEAALKEDMKPLAEFAHIGFLSVAKNDLKNTKMLAKQYYDKYFEKEDGTLFVIDMQERYIYIFSGGANYSIVSKRRAEVITDNCYRYASKKQYYDCAREAFDEIHELLIGNRIAQPMKYISNGILALLLALILNYFYVRKTTNNQGLQMMDPLTKIDVTFTKDIEVKKTNVKYPNSHYGGGYADTSSSYSGSSSSSRSSGSSSSGNSYSGGSSSHSGGSSGSFRSGGGGHKF